MLNIDSGLYFCPAHWLEHDVRIALVGCGATGSAIAPLLFKLNHIRRELTGRELGLNLFIFDPKNVTQTGMNRTGFFATEVGMNKAIVMANKLNTAVGYNFAVGYDRPFRPADAGKGFDFLGGAIDDIECQGVGAGFAVRKQDSALRDALSKAIGDIRADGAYKAMNDKYFAVDIYGN